MLDTHTCILAKKRCKIRGKQNNFADNLKESFLITLSACKCVSYRNVPSFFKHAWEKYLIHVLKVRIFFYSNLCLLLMVVWVFFSIELCCMNLSLILLLHVRADQSKFYSVKSKICIRSRDGFRNHI